MLMADIYMITACMRLQVRVVSTIFLKRSSIIILAQILLSIVCSRSGSLVPSGPLLLDTATWQLQITFLSLPCTTSCNLLQTLPQEAYRVMILGTENGQLHDAKTNIKL